MKNDIPLEDWVLVDTCVWASFFTKAGSPEKRAVDQLIDDRRVAVIGPVVTEVLLGFKRKEHADWVASKLRLVRFLDLEWDDWRLAAQIGRDLAASGNKVPTTDLLAAQVSRRCNTWLYSTDPHFDLIPDLKRFEPDK